MLFKVFLPRLVTTGLLRVIDPSGRHHRFGPGGEPDVTIRLHEKTLPTRLAVNPALSVGEAYMDGTLTIEHGSLADFLHICAAGLDALEEGSLGVIRRCTGYAFRRLHQYNSVRRSLANVAHHYDLSDELYELFLDSDRQYSCAYFRTGAETLEQAQFDKKQHIAAKLLLKPRMKVLDIGSGWGGLALHLAQVFNANVTGVTLSKEQLRASRSRAAAAGLSSQVGFHLRDYRDEDGLYDRIVSVGMFEHVGTTHYPAFFAKVRRLLAPDGVALLHAIGRMERPGTTNAWLRKYIFPGSYCPALSEVVAAVERSGLWITDIEILRLHYADTLREWARRFRENRERARELYDERFCRMWEFYLAACEMAFRSGRMMVFQIQLARHQNAVPLTRDYVFEAETATPRTVAAQ